jgi:hypothetical protein
VQERTTALVVRMNANTDTLSARGVHRDEYEREREYHQNYEPHDQYSRWETTGAQRRGHWRILVAHVNYKEGGYFIMIDPFSTDQARPCEGAK